MEKCAYHPKIDAVEICSKCGRTICEQGKTVMKESVRVSDEINPITEWYDYEMQEFIVCVPCYTGRSYQKMRDNVGGKSGEARLNISWAFLALLTVLTLIIVLTNLDSMTPAIFFSPLIFGIATAISWFFYKRYDTKQTELKEMYQSFVQGVPEERRERFNLGDTIDIYRPLAPSMPKESKEQTSTIKLDGKELEILNCCHQSARLGDRICVCGRKVEPELIQHFNST